jgi:hypothetical protein
MKKMATALASAAMLAGLAAPAGAAVVPGSHDVLRSRSMQPHQCGRGRPGARRGDCYDEHRPQHDGGGILY